MTHKPFIITTDGHRITAEVQLPCDSEPDIADYTSDRVFDGKRPISPERLAKLQAHAKKLDYVCGKCSSAAWYLPVGRAPECIKCGTASKTLCVSERVAK